MNRPPLTVIEGSKATVRKMRRSLNVDELLALPPPSWLIRGRLPSKGFMLLHGEPAAGKTFLMFDWCMALARGDDWHGHKTKQTGVIYVAGEGVAGLGIRMRAYIRAHGMRPGTQFRVVPQAIDFPNSVDELLAEIERVEKEAGWRADVVVLDTVARTTGGLDENSSQMGKYIESVDRLIELKKLVAGLHHPGKDAGRGPRGWSGMRGALDVEIELAVGADGATRTATWKKQKDAEIPQPWSFRLRQIETGERDDEGLPITSCVIEPCDTPAAGNPRARPAGDKQHLLHGLLGEMLKSSAEFAQGGAPASRPCVTLEAVAEQWRRSVPGEAGERNKLNRTLGALKNKGLIAQGEGWLWAP